MMGQKIFQPKQFYAFSLEERIPADHLLRQVSAVVDFSFVRRLTARFYSHTGQPGIDPVVLFKMALIGYLYGITSERRLAEEVRLHLAFMGFLGYDLDERPPDHSVLSKARRRFGMTTYQAFFTEIVRQCESAGLIVGQRLYIDSTLVRANASKDSVGSRALLRQLPSVGEHVAALWQENPAEGDEVADNEHGQGVLASEAADAAVGRACAAAPALPAPAAPTDLTLTGPHVCTQRDPPNGDQGRTNDLVVSRTDPDAGLLSRGGVPLALYHKVHVGVDGGVARIITALEVTPGDIADEELLDRVCKEHEGTTGRSAQEVIADTKYGTTVNYARLEAQGKRASIPPHIGGEQDRAIPREHFVYESARDRYACPQGQPLTRQGIACTGTATRSIIYRASPKACGRCPLKEACCGTARARTISRPDDEGLSDRVRAYLATAHAKWRLRQRLYWAEPPIAELKERHGLRRAQGRGHAAVLIQAFGAAMAYNIKKLVRRHGQDRQPIAVARRSQRSVAQGPRRVRRSYRSPGIVLWAA